MIPTLYWLAWTPSSVNADPTAGRVPLARGQAAPFAGVLLTPTALATVLAAAEAERARAAAELTASRETAAAELRAERERLTAELTAERTLRVAAEAALSRERELYERALRGERSEPWYRAGGFVPFLAGVLAGGGVCAASAAAVR